MVEAKYQYKCRKCGELFEGGITNASRAHEAMCMALYRLRDQSPVSLPYLFDTHNCYGRDHQTGIGDLVGYVVGGQDDEG